MAARCCLTVLAHRLDISGDVPRLDIGNLADLVMVTPGEEPDAGVIIRHAGVANGGGEEFEEAADGLSPAAAITRGARMPSREATACALH
jgi:hypothetical protein